MGIINSDEFATVGAGNGGELLKPYNVEINGIETTIRLTDADARRRGLLQVDETEDVDGLREQVAELKAKLAESEERERVAVEAKEKAEGAQANPAAAKAAEPPANKQAVTPSNKAADAKAQKA